MESRVKNISKLQASVSHSYSKFMCFALVVIYTLLFFWM